MTSQLHRSAAVVFAGLAVAWASPAARQAGPAAPRFTVPPGFVVERVAGPPLVDRPIVADFDEQGRLYVADSSGSNAKVEQQLAERPHRIVRLEDTDGDGTFDTRVVFADRMMLPQGTLWHDGSLYVAAPPSIWKLTDTDGDGVADQREEWFEGRTLTGCANDLHGPYLGPDGWIYWTKGAFAEQRYERPGREPLVTRAAHVFRRRPGTALVEPVVTGGMDNPVDVAFMPSGEAILTATFLEHPTLGRRDAIIHAVYGGLYGKPHPVIDGHPETGDLMPPVCQLGPAAPSGLTRYASRAFGAGYRDNFFAALFNMQKVTRHVLRPHGSTFQSRDTDFLVADSPDFHPTDVVEDADGSLLVLDTGAWYKLCCPTSQLAKPDVLGAIYRVRRAAAPAVADARGRAVPWASRSQADLAGLLDDRRPAVQAQAIARLAGLGRPAIDALGRAVVAGPTAERRRNAVWALTRIDAPEARAAARPALRDRDESVRRAAAHSAGLWRDAGAFAVLVETLGSPSPALRRVAAEALGRIGDPRAVAPLLTQAARVLDRVESHSVTYALIEIADPAGTAAGLGGPAPARRIAMLALDQMPGGGLPPSEVVADLESRDTATRETAWRIAVRHPEWGGALAAYFERRLGAGAAADERAALQERLSALASHPAVQQVLADAVTRGPESARAVALGAMAESRLEALPPSWTAALSGVLGSGPPGAARLAVSASRARPKATVAPVLREALLGVARDDARPADLRVEALGASGAASAGLDAELFGLLVASLDPGRPATLRMSAASIVSAAPLSDEQLDELVDVVGRSGPVEMTRLLPAFDRGGGETLGLRFVGALERSQGRANLRPDLLRPRLAKFPEPVRARGEALLASLQADASRQAERLDELVGGMLGGGDVRRGQLVFNSPKAACATCHAIGYRGGRLGPDLTSIGQIRTDRDLLEAIVFPNASFVRGYEPVAVTTSDGTVHAGVLKEEEAETIVVLAASGDETRIARADIRELQPGSVSLMPSGYGEQLTRQELADLLAFLRQTRWGAN